MSKIRSLHPQLQQKAIAELNEDPDNVFEELQKLKAWVQKQENLNGKKEDQILVSFLRGCKYNMEKSREKLEVYYKLKTTTPELYFNRDPLTPELQKILTLGTTIPLIKASDPVAPVYLLIRVGIDDALNMRDVFKVATMLKDMLLIEDDNLIVSGICLLMDMSNCSLGSMREFTISLVRKTLACFQKGYPLRIKGFHVLHSTFLWDVLYTVASPFMGKKFRKRITVLKSTEDMYKIFPKEVLPEEYGGTGGNVEDIVKEWKSRVESYRDWFLEDEKYRTKDKKRAINVNAEESILPDINVVSSSFRELSID